MQTIRNRIIIIGIILIGLIMGALSMLIYSQRIVNISGRDGGIITRTAAIGMPVPERGDQGIPENVGLPSFTSVSEKGTDSKFREFTMLAQGGRFAPDTFVVAQGDRLRLNMQAMDGDYDFSQPDYGFSLSVKKGETVPVEFMATAAGTFLFYCRSCGGPLDGAHGYLLVTLPRK